MNWEKIFTNNAINLQNKQTTHISPHQEMGRRPRKYFSKGVCVCVCVCVCVYNSLQTHSWPIAHQAPLSMGFPRQKYWSRLQFPSPGDLPNPRIEPMSPALADGFTTEPPHFKELCLILNVLS